VRRLAAIAFVLATIAPLPGARAVPAIVGGALASDNVDFVANIPDVAAVGAKIIGDTMYVTTLSGLRIYDIALGVPVLMGALALPHVQNESVDTNGRILIISADHVGGFPNVLYVIDVSNRNAPILRGVTPTGDAHTATCIRDCQYAWNSEGEVIDLTNPSAPRVVGRASLPGYIHHTDVDATGFAWTSGSAVYDTNDYGPANLRSPTLVAGGGAFGWHGSLRPDAAMATSSKMADAVIDPGELVLGTDENWIVSCGSDGPFVTSWFRTVNGRPTIERLARWTVQMGTVTSAKPVAVSGSSHLVDVHGSTVADAWYEQGTRFLDISDPRRPRQIGYFMPVVTESFAAKLHEVKTGPLPGLYVYTFDGARGMDVLRFTGQTDDPTVLAPRYNPVPEGAIQPHPRWGYACRLETPR
jgi:hypothetical protein